MMSLYQLLLALLDRAKTISWKLSSNPLNSSGPRRNVGLCQILVKFGNIPLPKRQAVAHRPMLSAVALVWPLQVSNLPLPSSMRSKGFRSRSKSEQALQWVGSGSVRIWQASSILLVSNYSIHISLSVRTNNFSPLAFLSHVKSIT